MVPPAPPSGPDAGSDREPTTPAPRWVKVTGAIALVVALLVAAMLLFGGGQHGPGRHSSSAAGHSLGSSAGEGERAGEHSPPAGPQG